MTRSRLGDLVADAPRVAVIGMAKNTGKTRTLVALLEEFGRRGRVTGLTSIGRDGEDYDVLDPRIAKPRVRVPPGGLVATAEPLLRARGVRYEVLERTGRCTPLGQTVIGRLPAGGEVEVAGPSSSLETTQVCATMLGLGADSVLIDGAINRRAAAAPSVADVVVLATGAALHPSLSEVVARTVEAADVIRLPRSAEPAVHTAAREATGSVAVLESGERVALDRGLTLGQAADMVERLFTGPVPVRHLLLRGALCESLAEQIRQAACGREVSLTVEDSTKVFLSRRSCAWYRRRGVSIGVLRPTRLGAVSVNPVAPGSHRLDSAVLRREIAAGVPGVLVCDVVAGADG